MRRSKFGGHLIRTRRPQSWQTHSSVPDSARPLRTISCVSRTDVTIQASRGNLGDVTPANAGSSPTQQTTPRPGRKRLRRAEKRSFAILRSGPLGVFLDQADRELLALLILVGGGPRVQVDAVP